MGVNFSVLMGEARSRSIVTSVLLTDNCLLMTPAFAGQRIWMERKLEVVGLLAGVSPTAYKARKGFYVMFLVSFLTGILRSFVLLFRSFFPF